MRIRQIIAMLLLSAIAFTSAGCHGENIQSAESTVSDNVALVATETVAVTTEEETTEYEGCIHEWGEWIITRFPTKENEGVELHYCMTCFARQTREIARLPDNDYRVELDIENILQFPHLPNGCEVVSLAIALNYLGFYVDPVWLSDHYLDQGPYGTTNPFYKYVGNPKSDGMGCYAPCIVNTAKKYFDEMDADCTALDISDADGIELRKWIDRGVPVIIWGTTYMNCDPLLFRTDNFNGQDVVWRAYSHCLVLVGYTANTYLFCDPLREGITEYQKSDVEESRDYVYRQACVVYDQSEVDLSDE